MATVWAARLGNWRNDPSSGWSHMISFHALSDLIASLRDEELRGKVSRLGIVAHGDTGGRVEFDSDMTPSTLSTFRRDLNRLRWYLKPNAMMTFYSCVAGQGELGSDLLIGLSRLLPGRTIVAFTVWGCFSPYPGNPGQIQPSTTPRCATMARNRMSPWDPTTKWAFEGRIVRWPHVEQVHREGQRCGNPNCDGHDAAVDRCVGWAPPGLAGHRP